MSTLPCRLYCEISARCPGALSAAKKKAERRLGIVEKRPPPPWQRAAVPMGRAFPAGRRDEPVSPDFIVELLLPARHSGVASKGLQ